MLILFGGSFILFGVSILTLKFCNLLKTNGAKGKPKASYAKKVKAKTELNYLEVTEYEKDVYKRQQLSLLCLPHRRVEAACKDLRKYCCVLLHLRPV